MKRQPTTQQITWFLDLYRNKQLDLEPPYQRKSVWSSKDRKFFLDTIFRNYPAPPIFIHRTVDDKGFTTYHVVDGKQRLETILMFFENKLSMPQEFGDINLDGKKFKDLPTDYKRNFWDYTLVVDFIDSVEIGSIGQVFDRVNRNARNLEPQELRHARYDGWFIKFVEGEVDTEFWWDYKISTRSRDKRMKNVQFVSELSMIIIENKIVGFDQDHIDGIYAKFDDLEELLETGEFDVEQFQETLVSTKQFIIAADQHNGTITKFAAGSNNNFYTLWAYIYLYKPQNTETFANQYEVFMTNVSQVKELLDAAQPADEQALIYYNNSKGAVTDFPQRQARLNALANSTNV